MRCRNRIAGYYDCGSRDMSPIGCLLFAAIIATIVLLIVMRLTGVGP